MPDESDHPVASEPVPAVPPSAIPALPPLTLLQQRYVEARVLGPLIRAFQREVGVERANAVAEEAVREMARATGKRLSEETGQAGLAGFSAVADTWRSGDALTIEVLERSPDRHDFNVTRCRFAEMYCEMGLGDIGHLLSCGRDAALCEGFSPDVVLTRTRTIMQGAPFCDFRYRSRAAPSGVEPA